MSPVYPEKRIEVFPVNNQPKWHFNVIDVWEEVNARGCQVTLHAASSLGIHHRRAGVRLKDSTMKIDVKGRDGRSS